MVTGTNTTGNRSIAIRIAIDWGFHGVEEVRSHLAEAVALVVVVRRDSPLAVNTIFLEMARWRARLGVILMVE